MGKQKEKWNEHLADLRAFLQSHPNGEIPANARCSDGTSLSNWVKVQRRKFREGQLSSEQIAAFKGLALVLETPQETALRHAEKYFQMHGNLDIRTDFTCDDGYRLGVWIRTVRGRADSLSPDVRQRLDQMGMIWDKQAHEWMMAFEKCKAYGDISDITDATLRNWLYRNRKKYQEHELTPEQVKLLDSIGALKPSAFTQKQIEQTPDTSQKIASYRVNSTTKVEPVKSRKMLNDELWMQHFQECKAFLDEHGRLPKSGEGSLPDWLKRCRQKWQNGKLSQEQIQALQSIGALEPQREMRQKSSADYRMKQWLAQFENCKAAVALHGKKAWRIPSVQCWMTRNRKKFAMGTLTAEQIRLLQSIGALAKTPDIPVDPKPQNTAHPVSETALQMEKDAEHSGFLDAAAYVRELEEK